MDIVKFKENIAVLIKETGYFKKYDILDETSNTIKAKLLINSSSYVQIYINFKKKLKNYVLIINGQRIFGRDCDNGKWHMHPWNDPSKHVFTHEISLKDFLFEVYEILKQQKLI